MTRIIVVPKSKIVTIDLELRGGNNPMWVQVILASGINLRGMWCVIQLHMRNYNAVATLMIGIGMLIGPRLQNRVVIPYIEVASFVSHLMSTAGLDFQMEDISAVTCCVSKIMGESLHNILTLKISLPVDRPIIRGAHFLGLFVEKLFMETQI